MCRVGAASTPHAGAEALRRDIYYFHGFDPASTGRYRHIFTSSAARLGVEVADAPEGTEGWTARRGGTETRFHYLRYDDLVRAAQSGGLFARLGRGLRTLSGYVADGAAGRIGARPLILMLSPYPIAFAPLFFAAGLSGPDALANAGLLAASSMLTILLLVRMRMILICDLFAYVRALAWGDTPEAETHDTRVRALAHKIGTSFANVPNEDPEHPEVEVEVPGSHQGAGKTEALVVGHSLGGIAAIHAVADLLDELPREASLSLLTLGSVHGVLLAQKGAGRDRLADSIAHICADPRVFWLDVSAPSDAFCVALTDPLLLIGAASASGLKSPRVISAQLRRAPRIPGDRRTLFPAMRRHMGYLLAPATEGGFDYADVTTGSLTLRDRFDTRGNSPKARMWHG